MKRRDFLKVSGASAGLALLQGCRQREQRVFEQAVGRGAGLAGESVWQPGVCGQCPAGCGTRVRIVNGAAKKIEGNPEHPINQGGLCALGQSALQELYNPDRILQPMRRKQDAGSTAGADAFEPISWQQAVEEAADLIAAARAAGPRTIGVVTGGDELRLALWRRFARALGSQAWSSPAPDEQVERIAATRVFGWQQLPYYDLRESDFVLGLGAAFLDRWRSPVHYARALVEQRQRRRSRFVQAEQRMSLTAAAADLWLPLRPGTEGTLARALAGAVLESSPPDPEAIRRYRELFAEPPPSLETAAEVCDLPIDQLRWLTSELLAAERPVVVSGGSAALHRHGLANVGAGMALNLLLGSIGREGGVFEGSSLALGTALVTDGSEDRPEDADTLGRRLGELELVIVSECNLVYEMKPADRAQLATARVIALASFFDDTALGADLILPIQTDLERSDLVAPSPGTRQQILGTGVGAVESRGEARHPIDIALALAATQEELALALPWQGVDDVISAVLEARSDDLPGAAGLTPARYLRQLRQDGGAWAEPPTSAAISAVSPSRGAVPPKTAVRFAEPNLMSPSSDSDGLALVAFESIKSGDGRGVNRPWLQELPDPMSSVMWGSWVEISPVDGQRLGLETGDRVRLSAENRSRDGARNSEAWVFLSPAARPGTIAVPLGQGHRDHGRYARGRGINPYDLLGNQSVEGVGVGALGAVRIELEKMNRTARAPIYGRGLRQAESIPIGWAPQDPTVQPTQKLASRASRPTATSRKSLEDPA